MKKSKRVKAAFKKSKAVKCTPSGVFIDAGGRIPCSCCGVDLGVDVRSALTDTVQKVDWSVPEAPQTIIVDALSRDFFCSQDRAIEHFQSGQSDPTKQVSLEPIQPIESCFCCGAAIKTNEWNRATTMTVETGPEHAIKLLAGWRVARFCNVCKPLGVPTERLDAVADGNVGVIRLGWGAYDD